MDNFSQADQQNFSKKTQNNTLSCSKGNISFTSEVSGPVSQVHGKVRSKICNNTIRLKGYAFYGGDAVQKIPTSSEDLVILKMFIRKDEIGLNKCVSNHVAIPIYCINGTSIGKYTITFKKEEYIVTMSDYDLFSVVLNFLIEYILKLRLQLNLFGQQLHFSPDQ